MYQVFACLITQLDGLPWQIRAETSLRLHFQFRSQPVNNSSYSKLYHLVSNSHRIHCCKRQAEAITIYPIQTGPCLQAHKYLSIYLPICSRAWFEIISLLEVSIGSTCNFFSLAFSHRRPCATLRFKKYLLLCRRDYRANLSIAGRGQIYITSEILEPSYCCIRNWALLSGLNALGQFWAGGSMVARGPPGLRP